MATNLSLPDYTTWPMAKALPTPYTAPSNGWIFVTVYNSKSMNFEMMVNNRVVLNGFLDYRNTTLPYYFPVKKGDVVTYNVASGTSFSKSGFTPSL